MNPVFNLKKSISVLSAALLLSVTAASAAPIIEKIVTPADQLVAVKYVGATDANFVFRLTFENASAEKFWLIVKNDAGDVVFQQSFKDAHFAKTIQLPKLEGEMHPTFIIRTGAEQVERKFVINRTVSENVEVTKG